MLKKTFINFKNQIPYFFIIKDIIILSFLIWIIKLLPLDFTYNNIISTVFGFNELQSFFLTLGAGLIGSTAIIFSILLFTVQSNSDSMPTGLLKDYLKEKKFINSFVYSLIIAILIACLSLNKEQHLLIYFVLTFLFFTYRLISIYKTSYYKAIEVITPNYHLNFNYNIVHKSVENLKTKIKHAKGNNKPQLIIEVKNKIENGINYCNYYAEIYMVKRDYEIVNNAYTSIVKINKHYINSIYVDKNDRIISYTLEELRKNFENALSTKNERLILIILKVYFRLFYIYFNLNNKEYSSLANHYLVQAINRCKTLNMPDVLMKGIELLSLIAQKEILDNNSTEITKSIELITELSLTGIVDKEYSPITVIALNELATINYKILICKDTNLNYANGTLIKSLEKIMSTEINYLDVSNDTYNYPYHQKFSIYLINLTNAIIQDTSDNKDIINTIDNINNYFDKLRQVLIDLFRESLKINSQSTIFLIVFIKNIIHCLITLLDYPKINVSQKSDLENMIIDFIGIFSFLEDINLNLRKHDWVINKGINALFYLSKIPIDYADISNNIKERFLSLAFHFIDKEDGEDYFASAIGAYIYINIRTSGNIDNSLVLINKDLKKHNLSKEYKSQLLRSLHNLNNNYLMQSDIEKALQSIEDKELVIKYIDSILELKENK